MKKYMSSKKEHPLFGHICIVVKKTDDGIFSLQRYDRIQYIKTTTVQHNVKGNHTIYEVSYFILQH